MRCYVALNGKEQRSGKAYGSKYEKDVIGTGSKLLRFFKYNPDKTCGGTLIAKKKLNITPGWDKTVVLTRFAPKMVLFDNADTDPAYEWLGEIPPRGPDWPCAAIAWRNGSDMRVEFYYERRQSTQRDNVGPAGWRKADNLSWNDSDANDYWRLAASFDGRPESEKSAEKTRSAKAGRRHERIPLGTDPSNARFVIIIRGISAASP